MRSNGMYGVLTRFLQPRAYTESFLSATMANAMSATSAAPYDLTARATLGRVVGRTLTAGTHEIATGGVDYP